MWLNKANNALKRKDNQQAEIMSLKNKNQNLEQQIAKLRLEIDDNKTKITACYKSEEQIMREQLKFLFYHAIEEGTNNIIYLEPILKLILQYCITYYCRILFDSAWVYNSGLEYYTPLFNTTDGYIITECDTNYWNLGNKRHISQIEFDITICVDGDIPNESLLFYMDETFNHRSENNSRLFDNSEFGYITYNIDEDKQQLYIFFHFKQNVFDL